MFYPMDGYKMTQITVLFEKCKLKKKYNLYLTSQLKL